MQNSPTIVESESAIILCKQETFNSTKICIAVQNSSFLKLKFVVIYSYRLVHFFLELFTLLESRGLNAFPVSSVADMLLVTRLT